MPLDADIASNLETVRRRIAAAAHRAHRSPADITLVAVSKTFDVSAIKAAAAAGQRVFGESRLQEAVAKADALRSLHLEWHFIGHLQSNKVRGAAGTFGWIQSVDSLRLLEKLNAAAADAGVRPAILIQVDLAHEATKHGIDESQVGGIVRAAMDAGAVDLRGLMLIPPEPDTPEDSRRWFQALRELRDRLVAAGAPAARLRELSMGMSHDFEIAIEEGATLVRVGTAIFGARPPAPRGQ